MLPVGTLLRGLYRIDKHLSSGGFGNTYLATHIEFNERYAIKEFFMKGVTQRDDNQTTVSVSNSENKDTFLQQKEKFKKEARRLRQLDNPHIVKVHDLFDENGTAYYVMDYIDGVNLRERLTATGMAMTESEVNLIFPQILDALKAVHDAGIWHLDLKPANIMLEKGGNIKLIDFGASKQVDAQRGGAPASTAITYTNGYAPREQMEQNYEKFGPWTDLYALGATLYNLLTNKRPPLPTDIDDDISEDKHIALPVTAEISTQIKDLVLWLMQTNLYRRPQSIREVQKRLSEDKPEPNPQYPKADSNGGKLEGMVTACDDTLVCPFIAENEEIEGELTIAEFKGKYGMINKDHHIIIPYKYDDIYSFFSEGLVGVKYDNRWGFVDKNANEVIPCIYEDIWAFKEGMACVKKNGKWGYINKEGLVIIPFTYSEARPFKNGYAKVMENGQWLVIDQKNVRK